MHEFPHASHYFPITVKFLSLPNPSKCGVIRDRNKEVFADQSFLCETIYCVKDAASCLWQDT